MTKLKLTILIVAVFMAGFVFAGCEAYTGTQQEGSDQETTEEETQGEWTDGEETEEEDSEQTDGQKAIEEINLRDIYGGGSTYLFTCRGEDYTAIYHYDNWCIYDSYKITRKRDMKKICRALIEEHPVHGSDYESFRTVSDMVYEWRQHNIAYKLLPDDNPWKRTTGNVDFDPEDQGKSLEEIYESRTGEEFDYMDHADDISEYLKRIME